MLSISDLKQKRNQWCKSNLDLVMLDAADCVHRVTGMYAPDHTFSGYAVSWSWLDSSLPGANVSSRTWATAQEAMDWVDVWFADHFQWFEAV